MVTTVAFSPDGTKPSSGSHDNAVRLWDAATEQ
jgi:WD40 repeat protein